MLQGRESLHLTDAVNVSQNGKTMYHLSIILSTVMYYLEKVKNKKHLTF